MPTAIVKRPGVTHPVYLPGISVNFTANAGFSDLSTWHGNVVFVRSVVIQVESSNVGGPPCNLTHSSPQVCHQPGRNLLGSMGVLLLTLQHVGIKKCGRLQTRVQSGSLEAWVCRGRADMSTGRRATSFHNPSTLFCFLASWVRTSCVQYVTMHIDSMVTIRVTLQHAFQED